MSDLEIWNQDCVTGMAEQMGSESADLIITSIPFSNLFMYSGKLEDVGNSWDGTDSRDSHFGLHMRFVVEQMLNVLRPGCIAAIHVQQLLTTKVQHGYMGRRDFRGAVVDLFSAGGFQWTGEIGIPKNPQAMAQRQKLHSLLFVTGMRDGRALAPAVNDYVLIFRKPGEGTPVPCLYDPQKNPNGWLSKDEWIRDAKGIWWDIQETDTLEGWRTAGDEDDEKHVCLARGSLVLTRDGHKPIEEVAVGDLVLTHRGRWRPVTAKRCNGPRDVVSVGAQGVANLRLTPDHRLWTRPGRTTHPRAFAMQADPEWMPASDTLGSYVNLPLPPVEPSPLTPEDWWVIGRWLGDGHLDAHGRAHISCSREETDGLIQKLAARAGSVVTRRTGSQVMVKDRDGRHSTEFMATLLRCGRGAGGKRLPSEALTLDPVRAEALLSGYLSADGHYVERYQRWTASSVSRALLLGMAMVAQRARGVVASVYAGRPAGSAEIEGRTVNTRQDWILSIPPTNLSGFVLDDGAWKKVRAIESAGQEEVWDLQVEEDESFVAEGAVVHNCPLQLEVIRRLVRLYSNPGDVVLDPFAGIGSTQYVALEQGRKARGFELKESYHRQALKNAAKALQTAVRSGPGMLGLFDDLHEAAS